MSDADRARAGASFRPPDAHAELRGAPAWMSALPPPPLSPATDPTPVVVRRRWVPSLASALGFGLMGAILYASLYILVGQEITAAAPVVGILVGSGLRLGGRHAGWVTGVAAVVLALVALFAGAFVGQACLDAIRLPAPLTQTLAGAFSSPLAAASDYLGAGVQSWIAVALTAAGALLATLAFRRRRED